ncbi:DbpA RNA binding domain-containing protein [Salinispira pacifica]
MAPHSITADSIPALAAAMIRKRQPGIQSLIISTQADDVRLISTSLRKALRRTRSSTEVIEAGTAETARKEAVEISRQPDIVVATNDRVIDHLRRGQLDLTGLRLLIINEPEEPDASGFNVDVQFILSKLGVKPQIVVFTSALHGGIEVLNPLLRRTVFLPYSSLPQAGRAVRRDRRAARGEGSKTEEAPVNGQTTGKSAINTEELHDQIREIIRRIHEEENPDELNKIRSTIRKSVPFFTRGYFAAYLLKHLKESPTLKVERQQRTRSGLTSLFVGIGKNRRVFPRDLIQLFSGLDGVAADDIGEIKILDNYSFVEIEPSKAASAISLLNGKDFRGRKLNVNYARKKD